MSYTLRGRLESRLAAAVLPLAAAAVLAGTLRTWWPLQLAALMIAVGVALDAGAYHPLLRYQPGWLAVPLGALELTFVMGLALAFDVRAPLPGAIAFFAGSWLWAQVLGHAAFPLLRPEYGEDGGELARAGTLAAAAVASVLVLTGGMAWATQPPTVHLDGVVRGPLILDHEQTLVGGVVQGGIVITADGVTVRGTTTVGGDYGIEVSEADDVRLERVTIVGAREDGIHARRSSVSIRDCNVLARPGTQGIDISFAMHAHSEIDGCHVVGGRRGIEVHYTMASINDNTVSGGGIALTEMSMGSITDNAAPLIYCGDTSVCEIARNKVDKIWIHYNSEGKLRDNVVPHIVVSSDSMVTR